MALRSFIIVCGIISTVTGQCTWQAAFISSSWHDSTRGDVTFGTTTLTGWLANIRSQTFNSWECIDNSSDTHIVMKATNQLSYSSLTFFVYACLQLTKVTDVSYTYYLKNIQESNGGYERLKFSGTDTLTTMSEICDSTADVPSQEFHVLVKSGVESAAQIPCPTHFLFSTDYVYNDTSTYACANSEDMWDVCSNTTEMTFNYTTCSQEIAFTSQGKLWCVASIGQCVSVYNQDSTLTATARRFACLCSNGVSVAVAPNTCTATQTPGVIPTGPDGESAIGHLVTCSNGVSVAVAPNNCTATLTPGVIPTGPDGVSAIGHLVTCSNGVSVAVAPNNCTASQTPGVIPTGPDGVSAIGHLVTVGAKYVDCAPTSESSSSNIGLIIGIVVALILIIVIVIIIIYCVRKKKRNKNNKVNESTKPILLDKEAARVSTVNETSRANRKRERTTLSREGTRLDKSLVDGRASVTSIGLEPKSERGISREKTTASKRSPRGLDREKSNVTLINVKSEDEDKKEKESPVKALLARLPCWPKEKESEPEKEPVPVVEASKTPPPTKKKAAADKKGAKRGAAAKGGKGKGGKKGGKGDKPAKEEKKGKKEKEEKTEEMAVTDVEDETRAETPKDSKKAKPLGKQPGPQFTSTPIPKDGKEKSFVAGGKMPTFVSMPSSLHKPEDKKTGWPFLVCCAGTGDNQHKPIDEPPKTAEPEPALASKKPAQKGKAGAKGPKGKPAKKGGEKGKKKGGKPETNGKLPGDTKDQPETEEGVESEKLERANTMPERAREKTVLSLTDAERVKVDVYVPNEQTQLQLKDTVTVLKDKNGDIPMEKSKTTLGLTRPVSSVSKGSKDSAAKANGKAGKGDKEKGKGKDKAKAAKGGKEKKGGGKKKKK